MVEFAYFKRVLEKEKKKRRRNDSEESIDGENQNEKKKKRAKKVKETLQDQDPYNFESDDDSYIDEAAKRITRAQMKTTDSSSNQSSAPDSDCIRLPLLPETLSIINEERYI